MISKIKKILAQKFPSLGKLKRFLMACKHVLSPLKASYSQHKEDIKIFNLLKNYNYKQSIYIDVGSNHPTSISNTYLLYRNGFRGICIEPNKELVKLHKIFRKNDIVLQLGCSNEAGIFPFYHSKIPVLSSFDYNSFKNTKIQNEKNFWYVEYIPVLKLDDIVKNINLEYQFISLLSIDVEGLDFNVLIGAEETINKVLLICIEFNDLTTKTKIIEFLEKNHFQLIQEISCNLIFKNTNPQFNNFLN